MSITIKDLAKIANVSHATVSRALNDSPLINEQTKKRIKEIAKQYNYTPNYNAKSLVLAKSYNIGLFFSTLDLGTSSNFFHEVVKGVSHIVSEEYNLVVRGIDECSSFNMITNKNFDGIIVMSQSLKDDQFILHVKRNKIPIIILNRLVEFLGIDCYLSDDKVGAYKAVQYLINQGHTKIALIEGKKDFAMTKERKEGYLQALRLNDIEITQDYIVEGDFDIKSGYDGMKKLFKLKDMPTAVFCSNDDMAVGALKAINEKKLKVPDEVSLIGFDDNGFTEYLFPSLTTVKRPIVQISQEGTKKLLEIIDKHSYENNARKIKYINTEFIIRQSVKKLN